MTRSLSEPPRTPFEPGCSLCGRQRLVLGGQINEPTSGVYLCMHCDHGGGSRQTAPVLQAYIDKGHRA